MNSSFKGIIWVLAVLAFALLALGLWRVFHEHAAPRVPSPAASPLKPARLPSPPPSPSSKPKDYLLRLSGSNTIGSELGPELVEAWLARQGTTDIHLAQRQAGGAPIPEYVVSAKLADRDVEVEIRAHGTKDAFADLASGAADIGMASRPIHDDEAISLTGLGDMREPASEHVLGLDGIAIITPQTNLIPSLTLHQLGAIFSGQIQDWSGVGGRPGPIRVYAFNDQSGTRDALMQALDVAALLPGQYQDSAALEQAVAADPAGIGFVGMPHVKTTRAVPVGDGAAAPLAPNVFTVKSEHYILHRRLYLYTAGQPANPDVSRFIQFSLSDDGGQPVVAHAGFVNLSLGDSIAEAQAKDSGGRCVLSVRWGLLYGDRNAYCRLRQSAKRLPETFYFIKGSSELDNRARGDLRRVLSSLDDAGAGARVTVAGFADSSGTSYQANCDLARARAGTVAAALDILGIKVKDIRGYCDELQIRDNATQAGQWKNRRVEVFIR